MVKGGKTSIGYVYSVMQELQLMRDKVSALAATNRELAKALVRSNDRCATFVNAMMILTVATWAALQNETKMELTKGISQALLCVYYSSYVPDVRRVR